MSSILWRLDMLDSMYLLDETTAIVDSIFLTSSFSSGSSEHFMASFLDDFWCLFPPKKTAEQPLGDLYIPGQFDTKSGTVSRFFQPSYKWINPTNFLEKRQGKTSPTVLFVG